MGIIKRFSGCACVCVCQPFLFMSMHASGLVYMCYICDLGLVCVFVCLSVCVSVLLLLHQSVCVIVCVRVCMCLYAIISVSVCMCERVCLHVCACISICVCVCVCVWLRRWGPIDTGGSSTEGKLPLALSLVCGMRKWLELEIYG